jgi:hypothetical protein
MNGFSRKDMKSNMKKSQFLNLLSHCELVIKKYKNTVLYPDYALYTSRYERMIEEIHQIKKAVQEDTLSTAFRNLEITNMLDRNDPDDILRHVMALNDYYLKNIRCS